MKTQDTTIFGKPSGLISPTSSFAPFRWPVFRSIWLANLTSALGSSIQMIAAGWMMTELTDSHLLVSLVQASVAIPVLFFGLIAGVIADNYDRRKVMLAANVGMLALSAVLAALAWAEMVQPWSLLALTLLIGGGFALNGPAWQASVRLMVPRADLPHAISLSSIAFNMARSVGPALGGVLLSLWGPKLAFTINTLTFLVMIAVLVRWQSQPTGRADKHQAFPAIMEAVRFSLASSPLRRVLARGFAFGVGVVVFQALIPLVAKEQLGGDEIDFGILLGAFGLGSILTALWISGARRRFGPEAVVTGGMISFAIAVLLLAFAGSMPIAVAASLLGGSGFVAAQTTLNVSMQLRSPEEMLGRCLSLFQAVTFGGMAIGSWVWGVLSDMQGIQAALLGAAAWVIGSLLILRMTAPMPRIGEGHAASPPGR